MTVLECESVKLSQIRRQKPNANSPRLERPYNQHQRDYLQPQCMHILQFGGSDILGTNLDYGSNPLEYCMQS